VGAAGRSDPGGAGQLVVNSSQGGGSKDTWVLSSPQDPADAVRHEFLPTRVAHMPGPDLAPDDGVANQQQQQQQQQATRAATATPGAGGAPC
jgi:hypothetical protein